MPRSSSELLFYGLMIGGFLLFNYVMQRLSKKVRQEQERAQRQEPAPSPEHEAPEDGQARSPQTILPAVAAPVEPTSRGKSIAVALAPRHAALDALFRSRRDLRHAIAITTVLGPCRSQEPPDSR